MIGRDKIKDSHKNSLMRKLISAFIVAGVKSFFRTVTFLGFLGFVLTDFVSAPAPIKLFSVPLSLVGIWVLLYHFDLFVQAIKRLSS